MLHTTRSHDQSINHMSNTQPHMMTKLPIKQYKTHTTLRLHGETIPTMIW